MESATIIRLAEMQACPLADKRPSMAHCTTWPTKLKHALLDVHGGLGGHLCARGLAAGQCDAAHPRVRDDPVGLSVGCVQVGEHAIWKACVFHERLDCSSRLRHI
jgi:hypothetical protein